MTAQIVGFVTREEAGLRPPESVSKRISPGRGGVAVHYGGGPQSAANKDSDHSRCVSTWRSWQNYHMSKNWVDIAYTGGFCNHGYAFAGRGKGVRTGANGTNVGNQNYYAIVWIGGGNQMPSPSALHAADWWLNRLRTAGAGNEVKPHNFFKETLCPGTLLASYADSWDGKAEIKTEITEEAPRATGNVVSRMQMALDVDADGKWGPKTDARALRLRSASIAKVGWPQSRYRAFDIEDVQSVIGTTVDGIWGPLSQAALVAWVKGYQTIMNVQSDGLWGPKSDGKFLSLRRRYLNNY